MTGTDTRAAKVAAAGVVSALVLLAGSASLLVGSPRSAAAQGLSATRLVAQATPAPAPPSTAPASQRPIRRVEARISALHKQLGITPAEEPQFNAFADVMRSNAQTMRALFQERAKSTDSSALGQLRWYSQITTAHAEGIAKLVPVFEALYQSMPEQQKKTADAVFRALRQRRAAHRSR
jgi:protein CpxP